MDQRRYSLADASNRLAEFERLGEELILQLQTFERRLERLHELGNEASALITPELIVGHTGSADTRR